MRPFEALTSKRKFNLKNNEVFIHDRQVESSFIAPSLTTAKSNFFLVSTAIVLVALKSWELLCNVPEINSLPAENKCSKPSSNNDGDDNVTIEVHGE